MPQGLYLYCLARKDRLPPAPLWGSELDSQNSLATAVFRDLIAVWRPVAVKDFSGPAAEAGMQDLAWIGPQVIRHQEVVAAVMRYSPVLPARFGTIFSSLANLEKVLGRHHDAIAGFLQRHADQEEWAVKGMLDRSGTQEHLFALKLARETARLEALSPGRRYFEEQRLRANSSRELPMWLKTVSGEMWTDLRPCVAAARERRLLSRQATGSHQDMVWNWALLVPVQAVPDFQRRLRQANDRYARCGLTLESTGPWPPYSFCPALDLEPEP
jgi:hypothetical protein